MNINIAITLVSCTACFGLSLFVFLTNKKEKINQIFSLFLLGISIWIAGDLLSIASAWKYLANIDYLTPLFLLKLIYIVPAFTPALYYHFIILFTKTKSEKGTLTAHYLASGFYLIGNCFSTHFFKSVSYSPNTEHIHFEVGSLYTLFMSHALFSTVYGVVLGTYRYNNSLGKTRAQMKYFLSATVLMVMAAIIFAILIATKKNLHIDNLFILFYVASLTYSFSKKQLMNISIMISKTIAIIVTTSLYVCIYIFYISLYLQLVSTKIDYLFIGLSCLYFLLTGLTFELLKIKIITRSQKLLLTGQYTTAELLHSISEKLPNAENIQAIMSLIAKECLEKMELQNAHIVTSNPDHTFTIQPINEDLKEASPLKNTHPLLYFFKRHRIPISHHELHQEIQQCLSEFNFDKNTLFLSVHSNETLLGIFIFSPKLCEDPFTESDVLLLSAITNQIVALFEGVRKLELHVNKLTSFNSHLQAKVSFQQKEIGEKKKIDLDLNLAKSVQHRIVTQKTPKIQNYHFETVFIPAKTLGGDYFSIMPFSNGTIGIVIADAVGKGVQAAVMTANFKGIHEDIIVQTDTPKQVIQKLNVAIHNNPVYDKCLPVFYGILNPISNTFIYCNGGQEPGLHFSKNTFKELALGGPPLGMTLDTTFDEETLQLIDSDILLFFTDGLTDSKNNKNEFFGIEKIQNSIKEFHEKHIETLSLSQFITKQWNEFRNLSDQDVDDMSIVMVEFQKVQYFKKNSL